MNLSISVLQHGIKVDSCGFLFYTNQQKRNLECQRENRFILNKCVANIKYWRLLLKYSPFLIRHIWIITAATNWSHIWLNRDHQYVANGFIKFKHICLENLPFGVSVLWQEGNTLFSAWHQSVFFSVDLCKKFPLNQSCETVQHKNFQYFLKTL